MTVQVRSVVSLVAVMSVGELFATDIQLKAYNANARNWTTASNWEGEVAPVNPDDTASLYVEACKDTRLVMNLDGNFAIDAVVTGPKNAYYMPTSRFSVRDFTGFNASSWPLAFGYNYAWQSVTRMVGCNFLGTTEVPSVVDKYYLAAFPYFGVPAANGCGRIDRLLNSGTFAKDGPGDLVLGGSGSLLSGLFLNDGPVTLATKEEPRTDCPAAAAAFHVDASLESSLRTYEKDGRTYVTNWFDVTQNGMWARSNESYKNGDFQMGTPYFADHTVNGRPLVDFGDYFISGTSTQSEERPSSWMEWNKVISGIREIFLAIEVCRGQPDPIGHNSDMTLKLLSSDDGVLCTAFGDVRVDGEMRVERTGAPIDLTKFHIISVALKDPASASAGWFGRAGSFSIIGGFRLGEALVYTNALTEVERRQTIAYLKARWMAPETHRAESHLWDLGDVIVGTNASSVKVAAADVARVRRVRVTEGRTLVKEGAGTLAVDRIAPSDAPVTVNGGAVRFTDAAGAAPLPMAMPANPLFHLDPTVPGSITYVESSETDVASWHDVRTDVEFAATPKETKYLPVVNPTGSPTGLPVVECAAPEGCGWQSGDYPRMFFPDSSCYEAFIVWKNMALKQGAKNSAFLGDKNGDLAYREKNALLGGTAKTYMAGAIWTVNGQLINPFDESFGKMGGNTDWVVIHYASATPYVLQALCALGQSYGGGGAVGEVVGYDRLLTDAERRGAEAYLMKRWLGKDHPDNVPWAGSLTFGADAEAVIDTACDIAPATLTTSSATLKKKGLGTATVGAIPSSVEALSFDFDAEGKVGGLAVSGEYEAPATMSVTLTLPSEEVARGLVGTAVRLIGAESVTGGANVAGWTLTAVNCGRVVCGLMVRADGVYATFSKPGLMLIFR